MTAKINPVVRFLPSLTDVAFVLPLALLFGRMDGVKSLLGDGDTGWHVRTGEWILAHHTVPHADLFSFTKPAAPWFAWEWLSDVLFAWLHLHGGLATVVAASILLICLTSALVFRLLVSKCENRLVALAVTFLVLGGSSVHWLARPHLFTMLFVVIWMSILESGSRPRLIWLLPVFTVLWTNLHGAFFVGILLPAAFAAGKLLEIPFASSRISRYELTQTSLNLILVALACAGASLVNPYGYHLHQHIVEYLLDTRQLASISEFQTLSFHAPPAIFWEIMLGLSVWASFDQARALRFTAPVLMLGWAHLSLMASRNIPLFLLISAPFVAVSLDHLFRLRGEKNQELPTFFRRVICAFDQISREVNQVDAYWRVYALSFTAALVITVAVCSYPPDFKLRAEYDPKRYPAAAIALLKGTAPRHVFCDDEWGDYLAYRLYPTGRVFIDGRSDFYGTQFGQDYQDILGVKVNWEKKLSSYGVDSLLLSPESALAGAVKESPRWKAVYDDGTAILFEPTAPDITISTNRRSNTEGGETPIAR